MLQGCIRSYNNKFPAQKSFKWNMRQLCTLFSHLSYSWYQPTHSLSRLRSFCKTFWVQTLLSDGSLLLFPVVSSVIHGVHWTNIWKPATWGPGMGPQSLEYYTIWLLSLYLFGILTDSTLNSNWQRKEKICFHPGLNDTSLALISILVKVSVKVYILHIDSTFFVCFIYIMTIMYNTQNIRFVA